MAKKLKCWRKSYERSWHTAYLTTDEKKGILVWETTKNNWNVDYLIERGERTPLKTDITKPQALKFAKSYMKKHDKC